MEIEIGLGKRGHRAYSLEEISIVPSRRTRDPEDIDISWQLACHHEPFRLPMMASAMDSSVSPSSAAEIGRLGGLPALNLEGIWTRYEDAHEQLAEIGRLPQGESTARIQQIYGQPVDQDLISRRIKELKSSGERFAVSVTPARVERYLDVIMADPPDFLIIQATVVSADHVSNKVKPLKLKEFIRSLDLPVFVGNCASYDGALHLMRTGAVGVLVGVGPGEACTSRGVLGIGVPQATAIANAVAARTRHLDETGIYVPIIADGGMSTGGLIAKAITCGADAVMIGSPLAAAENAPCPGYHWGMATPHADLPRGVRVQTSVLGTLEEILIGPAHENDGHLNLFGALRTSMATCGHRTIKDFQKAEVMVAPSINTEGKSLQHTQHVGMGA